MVFVTGVAISLGVWSSYLVRRASVIDGYHQWAAGFMVLEYVEANDGEWPRNWECLEAGFDRRYKGGNYKISFPEFKQRVVIDFSANPIELRQKAIENDEIAFNVIYGFELKAGQQQF